MRVLFWSLTFWPNIGGMEVLAARLLTSLRERGHQFLVVAPKNYTELPDHDRFHGIPIRRLPFQHTTTPSVDHIADVRARVLDLKRAFAADLVHINGLGAMAFFHLTTAHAHRAPVLVTLHGDWGAQGDSIAAQTLRAADWVAGCSAAILRRARQLVPEICSRSSVVYNGIAPTVAPAPAPVREPRLLYVGRLAHEKGADVAIDAFALLKRRLPDAHLTVAGDGPLRAALEQRATRAGVRESTSFLGWVVPDRVTQLIGAHAAVLMPSREDSLPLVALEAGAMARPVVASRVGGLPEIVAHEETGLLVDADDACGFADAAARLLFAPDTAERMGRAARDRVADLFGWERHVAAYDALYRSLALPSGRPLAAVPP
jgi:glycogen(starch) synthase